LYEDENDNYNYESGKYSTIEMKWNENAKTITIMKRKGSFPGMPMERTFRVVWVNSQNGTGIEPGQQGKIIIYKGEMISIRK
jgi:alpha-D-xyloside xylohydrolase